MSIFIEHENGDTSTLWKWKLPNHNTFFPTCLNSFFSKFEAADLLSSTFKISSPNTEIIRNTVPIVYSQSQLKELVIQEEVQFPVGSVPFMMQTGNWIYAYTSDPDSIWEWDLEYPSGCEEYRHLIDILEEWREAVSEE